MSGGHAFTPTRELASAAAESASRAYAQARETSAKFATLEAEVAQLRIDLREVLRQFANLTPKDATIADDVE